MLFNCSVQKIIKIALLAVGITTYTCCFADDDDVALDVKVNSGQRQLLIDENKQKLAGIKTIVVNHVRQDAEFEATGKVISIQPLLALRERYLSTHAELKGAKAKQNLTGLHLERQKELFRHGIAPKRSLQDQEAQGTSDQAAVTAAQAKLAAITNEVRLSWGDTLGEWALTTKAAKLADFIAGKKHLLLINIPPNKQLAAIKKTILVELSANRARAKPATLISAAVSNDNTWQGQSYYFQTDATGLNIGMKMTAWIPDPTVEQNGVMIPESALIWYLDQAFVYVKTAKDAFSRRALQNFSPVVGGYLVNAGLAAGDEIVLTGGQMLLSEELKQQIPDED